MLLTPAVKTVRHPRALLSVALVALLLGWSVPALADRGGDSSERPDQLRIVNSGDVPTSQDPYETPIFTPEVKPANDAATPPDLTSLMNQRRGSEDAARAQAVSRIRLDAMREAALSYGARGGLARRTWEVRQQLDLQQHNLDKTFNFAALTVSAPSGLLIEPPIVTEAEKNVIVSGDGQEAAVSDTLLRINREARIVTAPREWRTYLERDWGKVEPPPDVLLPKSDSERLSWAKWVAQGWEAGYKQGNEIFQADLDRMVRDYTGMVRYRWLLSQNMISAPYALQEDRGVTGGGSELRIGDRALTITGQSELQARPDQWQPVPR